MAQLSEENVTLKSQEQGLLERCQSLEQQLAKAAAAHGADDSPDGTTGAPQQPLTPRHRPYSCHHPATPVRPIPGETELESLQIENSKLKKELQCLQTNHQLTSQKLATVKKDKKEIEQSLVELQSEFDRILSEKANTQKKLEETRATLCNKLSSMSTGQEREEELEQEVEGLKSELTEVITHNDELQGRLRAEEERLVSSEELSRKLQEKSKSLKEWKARAESEFAALNARLQELEQEVASYHKCQASHFSQQRQESEAIACYKQKLERVRGECRELEERLHDADQALDKEQSERAILEKNSKTLKRQLAVVESAQRKLQEERGQSSSLSREMEELKSRLDAITEENVLLREECDRLEAEQKQNMEQIEALARSGQEHCQRADSQEEVVRCLQEQIGRRESELDSAAESRREREAQCVSLTVQIEELQVELTNVQSAKHHYELEVGELVQKLEELEQQNFELSNKLSDAHNETALMVATRDGNSTKLDELRQKFRDVQALLLEKETQLSELKYSHKLLQSENVNMVSQVSALSEMVAARNAKIESLQTEVMCYESSTRDIMSQIVALEEEHGTCARQKQALQEKIDRTSSFARNAERQERELEGEISSLRGSLREAREYGVTLESANKELDHKLLAQAEREDELRSSCQQSERKIFQLERELQERENAITSVKGELEFVTKSSSDVQVSLQAEVESLNGKCGELRAKCEEHRKTEVQMKSEVLQLQNQMSELQTVIGDLRNDRQPLQDRCDQARSDLVRVQDELYLAQKEIKSMKSELRYQKRKRAEVEEQLQVLQGDDTAVQFELLREELLKVLDDGDENTPSVSRRRLKGILKQSKKQILKPLHNIAD